MTSFVPDSVLSQQIKYPVIQYALFVFYKIKGTQLQDVAIGWDTERLQSHMGEEEMKSSSPV